MRRVCALGYCAAYLLFGFVAGGAHAHESADHHEETRGLHLDHAHLSEAGGHGSGHHHGPATPDDAKGHVDSRHVGHHEGDAVYLTVEAQRLPDSDPRVDVAIVAVGETVDPPPPTTARRSQRPNLLRGPPTRGPAPPRAPPA